MTGALVRRTIRQLLTNWPFWNFSDLSRPAMQLDGEASLLIEFGTYYGTTIALARKDKPAIVATIGPVRAWLLRRAVARAASKAILHNMS